jgi:hypothetical protein
MDLLVEHDMISVSIVPIHYDNWKLHQISQGSNIPLQDKNI